MLYLKMVPIPIIFVTSHLRALLLVVWVLGVAGEGGIANDCMIHPSTQSARALR